MSATGKPYGYFWNSDNGDRTYDAESFEEWTRTFFTTGVMPDTYVVQKTAGATRGVEVVSLGYCNVNGKVWKPDTSTVPVTIATASSQYPRIDSVVIERNDADRAFYIKVVTGSLSGDTPVAPAPVRSGGVYQLVLAHIYVAAGSTTIETANITDTRANANLCGWITGTVDEIDISQLLAQSTAQFDAWFQEMKDQLSEDAAGALELAKLNRRAFGIANTPQIATNTGNPYIYSGYEEVAVSANGYSSAEFSTSVHYGGFDFFGLRAGEVDAGQVIIAGWTYWADDSDIFHIRVYVNNLGSTAVTTNVRIEAIFVPKTLLNV